MAPRIGILPDIHMRTGERERVTAQLETTIDRLASKDIDLLVAPGDIIQHGETADADLENLERVQDLIDRLDCPARYMAGNHDAMNIDRDRLEDIFDNELWGRTELDGETLIFLDTSAPWLSGSRGEVTDEQLTFLDEALTDARDATLFVHHPIHYHDVSQTYWWSSYPERAFCGNKKEINRVLDDYDNVRGVVNAHLHENDLTRYRGIPHVTVNAFSKETREKPVTGTYAIMDIREQIDMHVYVEGSHEIGYSF